MDSEIAICNLALAKVGDTAGFIGSLEDPSLEAQVCKLEYPQVRDELFAEFNWPRATRHAYLSQLGGSAWVSTTPYTTGQFVSYTPASANVVNMPETIGTFVYVALADSTGSQPDISPTAWAQVSRAAWAYVFKLPGDVIEVQGLYKYGRNPREDQKVPYEIGSVLALDVNGNDVGPGTVLYTDTGLPYMLDWTDSSAGHSVELVYTAQITDPKQFPPLFTAALYWSLAVKLALEVVKDPDKAAHAQQMADRAKMMARAAALREIHRDPAPVPSHLAARRGRSGCR